MVNLKSSKDKSTKMVRSSNDFARRNMKGSMEKSRFCIQVLQTKERKMNTKIADRMTEREEGKKNMRREREAERSYANPETSGRGLLLDEGTTWGGVKNIRVLRRNDVACNLTGLFTLKLGTEYASQTRASDS